MSPSRESLPSLDSLERHAAGIGALADPLRRALYRYVISQPAPVGRDQAADAVRVARHQAKFHLDRLAEEGLLEVEFARLTGRTGPGAGRTSKLYRRARNEIAVSLPPRQYELAGRLMADAIVDATNTGTPVIEVLNRLAYDYGRRAATAVTRMQPADAREAMQMVDDVLAEHGYEPRYRRDEVYLTNCPFHGVAQEQTQLACQMNHALITGVTDALGPLCPRARLCPGDNRCCVVLDREHTN